jgi:hypothetical protein
LHDEFDFEAEEKQIKESFLKTEFSVNDIEARVLDLIRKGETLDAIVEAMEESKTAVQKAYADLSGRGLIEGGKVTDAGIRELATNQPDFELEILYSYELRPDVDGPPILPNGRTREFCDILLNLNRLYTRQEIEQISLAVDRNVWRYRGGWYSDPTKPHPTPFCRHIWSQNLTVKQ